MVGQRVRDPLHNLIEFQTSTEDLHHVLWQVLQTRPFQRLRRVRQLGFSDVVYPGATHTRFAHSLGVFHTAARLIETIKKSAPRPQKQKIDQTLAAALLHDVGHGPLSHAFEPFGKRFKLEMAKHETVSERLITDSEITPLLETISKGFAGNVADMVCGKGEKSVYSAVVSSQFDADRLDYMRRDRLMTGTQNSAIDFEWLVANLEVGELPYGVDEVQTGVRDTFVLGPKAFFAAETYILALFQLYPTVYFHKATRGAEKIFEELLCRLYLLTVDGSIDQTGLPENHSLIKFFRDGLKLEDFLELDDTVIWGSLSLLATAKDKYVAEFATRLRDRMLFKAIDVRARLEICFDGDEDRIDHALNRITSEISARNEAKFADGPRILFDRAERSPYKTLESGGPLNQIHIRQADDALVDIRDISDVVRSIKSFKLYRAYVARDDCDSQKFVDDLIQSEISDGQLRGI